MTTTKQLNFKNGQMTTTDSFPKKINEWPISTWKDPQHHFIREVQIKLQWDTTSDPLGWVLPEKNKTKSVRNEVEKLEPWHTVGGIAAVQKQ